MTVGLPAGGARLRILRLGLLVAAIGWGISLFFTFCPWPLTVDQLQAMGAERIAWQPLLEYWLRMASAAFAGIGGACALACWRPAAFPGLCRLVGPFHLLVAVTLAVAAWRTGLTPVRHPTFIPDITFCVLVGLLTGLPLFSWAGGREDEVARKGS